MAGLAAAPDRRASFREEKTLAALSEPLVSFGRLAYRRPAHLEKLTTSPAPESLVVDGARLVLTPGQDAPRVVDLDGQPEIRALVDTVRGALSGDLGLLRRTYDVRASGTPTAWRITLLPRDERVRKLVRLVEIEGEAADPLRITTTEPNGDTDRLDIQPDK